MRLGSLSRLVETARALPGEKQAAVGLPGAFARALSASRVPPVPVPVPPAPGDTAAAGGVASPEMMQVQEMMQAQEMMQVQETPDTAETILRLRRRVGALFTALSSRLDPALTAALVRAETAWDQFDAFAVFDERLAREGTALRLEAASLAAMQHPPARAAGVEMLLALDGALGLVALVERRLATLVRLRIRGAEPALLPGGRPFLDVAAALAEAARAWA